MKKFSGKSFLLGVIMFVLVSGILLLVIPSAQARPPKPGPNYVWVPAHVTNDGYATPGHWRLKNRAGYLWKKGYYDAAGTWVPSQWKPLGSAPSGKVWIRGHHNRRGKWIRGRWKRK